MRSGIDLSTALLPVDPSADPRWNWTALVRTFTGEAEARRAMGDDDSDDSSPAFDTVDLLELAREEGHRTIDRQIQTFDDIDDKAARTLRLNLVVLSILLTGFSVVASDDGFPNSVVTAELPNRFIYLGILSILLSTILAAFVYTGSNYRSGMSGRDLQRRILNDDIRPIDALYDTVDGYARWTQHNFSVNTRLAPLSTAMLLCLISGLVLITAGVFDAFVMDVALIESAAILLALSVVTWRSGFYRQVRRYLRYPRLGPGEH